MKVLLDNCVHSEVRTFFPGDEVRTARSQGWQDLKNGELLRTCAKEFTVLVTIDKNIRHQQNLNALPIKVLEINTLDGRIEALRLFKPYIPAAIAALKTHKFVSIRMDGSIEALSPVAP